MNDILLLAFSLEAFNMTIYFINRMPIQMNYEINYNKTPCECLCGKLSDFSHLHSFRCLYYSWLHPYTKNKLENRSIRCIFLGYNMQHKGYKCYDVEKKMIYISRHVKFYDDVCPSVNSFVNSIERKQQELE
jgi:hypothetical protein